MIKLTQLTATAETVKAPIQTNPSLTDKRCQPPNCLWWLAPGRHPVEAD